MGSVKLQSLYNHSLKSRSEGYKCIKSHILAYLAFFITIPCPKVTMRKHIKFYTGRLICQ